ncbi:hypothetical protein FNW02_29055 [Komarekiella sp. 'clone 1']|uniref:Uncharacterized protein n=1 Tax=Komarekiella delphini-convector SJRDD-AB1 TaxID=2593771 RepID=A0AA40VU27_9NOST|nr:hypothetical protein [Komarekiella delphini-convector]MBD6619755.1 hypothetical protein [Komarekiella delphini-convector SJRDD-AB1]
MNNDLDFKSPELFGSVVFRPDFNSFKTINASQAWSLFFTGGREDKKLDSNPRISLFFTSILLVLGVSGFARAVIIQTFFPA